MGKTSHPTRRWRSKASLGRVVAEDAPEAIIIRTEASSVDLHPRLPRNGSMAKSWNSTKSES